MYSPFNGLSLTDVTIIGLKGDILRGERIIEETVDPVIEPLGVWPTDHKSNFGNFPTY